MFDSLLNTSLKLIQSTTNGIENRLLFLKFFLHIFFYQMLSFWTFLSELIPQWLLTLSTQGHKTLEDIMSKNSRIGKCGYRAGLLKLWDLLLVLQVRFMSLFKFQLILKLRNTNLVSWLYAQIESFPHISIYLKYKTLQNCKHSSFPTCYLLQQLFQDISLRKVIYS